MCVCFLSSLSFGTPFTPHNILQSHLFLHHILHFHLGAAQVNEAVSFATHYQELVFFAHALEILLHTVVEYEDSLELLPSAAADTTTDGDESETKTLTGVREDLLPAVVEFLDHFDVALDVVVSCARKTEVTRWPRLFDIVGKPRVLFEVSTHPRVES